MSCGRALGLYNTNPRRGGDLNCLLLLGRSTRYVRGEFPVRAKLASIVKRDRLMTEHPVEAVLNEAPAQVPYDIESCPARSRIREARSSTETQRASMSVLKILRRLSGCGRTHPLK